MLKDLIVKHMDVVPFPEPLDPKNYDKATVFWASAGLSKGDEELEADEESKDLSVLFGGLLVELARDCLNLRNELPSLLPPIQERRMQELLEEATEKTENAKNSVTTQDEELGAKDNPPSPSVQPSDAESTSSDPPALVSEGDAGKSTTAEGSGQATKKSTKP